MWTAPKTLPLFSSLLLTAPLAMAAPQQSAVASQAGVNSEVVISDAQIDETLQTLSYLQSSGQLSAGDLTAAGDMLAGWCGGPLFPPDDQVSTRERLRYAIENLVERFVSGWETRIALLELELAVIDARMDRALGWLEDRARDRGATREQYQRVADAWTARAEAHLEGMGPSMEHFMTRALEVLDHMISGAIAFESGMDQLRLAVIEERLERSLHFLRIHAQRRGATRAQYEAYVQLFHQRARLRAALAQEL